jgi:hypothetical protein
MISQKERIYAVREYKIPIYYLCGLSGHKIKVPGSDTCNKNFQYRHLKQLTRYLDGVERRPVLKHLRSLSWSTKCVSATCFRTTGSGLDCVPVHAPPQTVAVQRLRPDTETKWQENGEKSIVRDHTDWRTRWAGHEMRTEGSNWETYAYMTGSCKEGGGINWLRTAPHRRVVVNAAMSLWAPVQALCSMESVIRQDERY